jgi:hypothetical protein
MVVDGNYYIVGLDNEPSHYRKSGIKEYDLTM